MKSASRTTRHGYRITGSGPVLVMHPGLYEVGGVWTAKGFTTALAKDHTVVEVDPIAHGTSQAPDEVEAYRLENQVASLVALFDELGIAKAGYWGYSMGAWVGYGLAAYAPERLSCLVAGAFDPIEGLPSAYKDAVDRLGMAPDTDWVKLLRNMTIQRPDQAPTIEAGDPAKFRYCQEAMEKEYKLDSHLDSRSVPLQFYCGTKDPYHANVAKTAARIGAGFFSVSGADHYETTLRAPAILEAVQPFLAEHLAHDAAAVIG